MHEALLLITLLAGIVAAAIPAQIFRIPYPIAFVVVGLLLAFIPGLPRTPMDPQVLFLIVLPPLLFSGGWGTDWQAFKRDFGAIWTLAVGLVIFTTVVVAVVAHHFGGLDWATAFVLGAIVSPPDAVAAEAIFERMAVSRRIVTIVTGEGLVNDGTALVLYRFALAAVLAGTFSFAHATVAFVFNVIGGVLWGLFVGWVVQHALKLVYRVGFDDVAVVNVVGILAPYCAYLPADAMGVSGVLAAVTAGVFASQRSLSIFTPEGRVVAGSLWTVMVLLLNGFVFLEIGLQLPQIVGSISHIGDYALLGAIVSVIVIAVRIAWVFPIARLRRLNPRVAKRDPLPTWQQLLVLGWSGMRGIVSLAAALALPFTIRNGAAFPARSEIIFVTLCVIVVTLLLHGLTLGPLITWLGLSETDRRQQQEMKIRVRALQEGIRYLHEVEPTMTTPAQIEAMGRLMGEYERRVAHLEGHLDEETAENADEDEREIDRRLETAALDAERKEIARLRHRGEIPDDVYQAIEYDLDLAGLRLH
jgi:monovalent cation/hydrogen antiporter